MLMISLSKLEDLYYNIITSNSSYYYYYHYIYLNTIN